MDWPIAPYFLKWSERPRRSTGSSSASHCRSESWTGPGTPTRSRSSPSQSSSTPGPTRPPTCTSWAPFPLPARRLRCRRGGTNLRGSRPIVHVTQGTIANRDYRQIIAPTLEALAEDDLIVVVSTGGRPLDTLPRLPANARAAEYLPYDALLPKTDVYVTNGGYGGVQYALRYGVPIVTSSGQEDKPEVAARIAWSGVGLRLKTEEPTPGAVGAAVRSVLHDPAFRTKARKIAASMSRAGGLPQLAKLVDQLASNPPQHCG